MKTWCERVVEVTARCTGLLVKIDAVVDKIRADFGQYAPGLRASGFPVPGTDEGKLMYLLVNDPNEPYCWRD